MGKGDPKTKRGKIFRKSYGKYRKRKKNKTRVMITQPEEPQEIVSREVIEEVAEKVEKKTIAKEIKAKKPAAKKPKKEPASTQNTEVAENEQTE